MRVCPDCGVDEVRTSDRFGRQSTNLDPISGRCVNCLVVAAQSRAFPAAPAEPEFDVRAAQARNDA
jgi:hypothetical protein